MVRMGETRKAGLENVSRQLSTLHQVRLCPLQLDVVSNS